jgi:hypothetical protein
VSSSDQSTANQQTDATFKITGISGPPGLPYLELPAGAQTNFLVATVLSGTVTDARLCSVQVQCEFDLSGINMLPGHVVFRSTLPEKLGEQAHVKSDAEVAAEIQNYKQAGIPVWDFGKLWRGRILSNTILLSCNK